MQLLLSLIFFIALSTTVFFFGKLITWAIKRINPKSLNKEITNEDILKYNLIMVFSIILWSILFYFKT